MPIQGEYEPSPWDWVREQVDAFERSGGSDAATLWDTGLPIIVVTTRGNKTGKVRKMALMRVEHDGEYALIASMGGAPDSPVWYHNIKADPHVVIQDGADRFDATARETTGEERATWWKRAVEAYPDYEVYQQATTRIIPVFVVTRR